MSNSISQEIEHLVDQLASDDTVVRIRARESLVEIGAEAVPAICRLADARKDAVRWECAKTLSEIGDPASIDTLIRLLEDSEEGTRWDAAVGLINVGKSAVVPLLGAIIHRSTDYTIIDGARHVVHEFSKTSWGEPLKPLYEALNSTSARESAPVEAEKALGLYED
jgi:HEAT repeat protein